MGSSLWYADSIQNITSSHQRYSKIIGVLWAIFTVCYLVISSTAFFAPEWIALEGHNFGKIGLWSVCTEGEQNQICFGKLENFMSFPGRSFQAATIFAGLAVFSAVLTICAMLFFLCCHSSTVFFTCAWMQLFSGICMVAGCVTFPLGWSEEVVQTICLNSKQFVLGHCEFRLGFLLAILTILDAFVLCVLAFIQASQYSNLKKDSTTPYQGKVQLYCFTILLS
ncbi:hypothetical protein WA026_011714 [Henosepilachna vigintioctopunctata]|uniref:LHFPL tetraspan subfamily member 3 protein n=1 Tax=Henosepilachna vigintioctopunctata TaxID=420089 RepID=A0AAW1UHA0_9CUCU